MSSSTASVSLVPRGLKSTEVMGTERWLDAGEVEDNHRRHGSVSGFSLEPTPVLTTAIYAGT